MQEFTAKGEPRFVVGQIIQGFNFGIGTEVEGKIVKVVPHLVFGYELESGQVLGPYDDIYTRSEDPKGELDIPLLSSKRGVAKVVDKGVAEPDFALSED